MPNSSTLKRLGDTILSLCKPDFYYEGTLDLLEKISYDNSFSIDQFDEIKECMITQDPKIFKLSYNKSQVDKLQEWRDEIVKQHKETMVTNKDA